MIHLLVYTNTELIAVGSNSGTCKALATKMADTAEQKGFNTEIQDLNAVAAGNLPTDRPVAIVTTSYEGQVRNCGSPSPHFSLIP